MKLQLQYMAPLEIQNYLNASNSEGFVIVLTYDGGQSFWTGITFVPNENIPSIYAGFAGAWKKTDVGKEYQRALKHFHDNLYSAVNGQLVITEFKYPEIK